MENSFLTSPQDTPCRIAYPARERKAPPELFLSKWEEEAYLSLKTAGKGEKVQTVERAGKTLQVETNKRRHLLRRLDDENIEYDILLSEPPRRGEITLPLSFPRGLSFYKQGVQGRKVRPEVQGSYAVYHHKKNNRYKTGKLCHIYRPRLFDSRGLWAWGDLEQDGENLVILLPEEFMKNARYPVTVDPVIGTSSVGASHQIWDDDWVDLRYEMIMPANPYQVPQTFAGACTFFIYAYRRDGDGGGYPVLYASDASNPTTKISSNEVFLDLRYPDTQGAWYSSSFNVSAPLGVGTSVWLAFMARYMFYPYFDEGAIIKVMDVEEHSTPPNTFITETYTPDPFLLSMYFSYESTQNFSRTINLFTAPAEALKRGHQSRRLPFTAPLNPIDLAVRSKGMDRILEEQKAAAATALGHLGALRREADTPKTLDGASPRLNRLRKTTNTIMILTTLETLPVRLRRMITLLAPKSHLGRRHQRKAVFTEDPGATSLEKNTHHTRRTYGEILPCQDGMKRRAGVAAFLKELTLLWDYLSRRKSKSKEEVTLFSPVTLEQEIYSP